MPDDGGAYTEQITSRHINIEGIKTGGAPVQSAHCWCLQCGVWVISVVLPSSPCPALTIPQH